MAGRKLLSTCDLENLSYNPQHIHFPWAILDYLPPIPVLILQLSDPHLLPVPDARLRAVPTYRSFRQVLRHLDREPVNFDWVILTGDLAHDEQRETYRLLRRTLEKRNTPWRLIPGNHDSRVFMWEVFPEVSVPGRGCFGFSLELAGLEGAGTGFPVARIRLRSGRPPPFGLVEAGTDGGSWHAHGTLHSSSPDSGRVPLDGPDRLGGRRAPVPDRGSRSSGAADLLWACPPRIPGSGRCGGGSGRSLHCLPIPAQGGESGLRSNTAGSPDPGTRQISLENSCCPRSRIDLGSRCRLLTRAACRLPVRIPNHVPETGTSSPGPAGSGSPAGLRA